MGDVSLIATLIFFVSAFSCIFLAGFLSHMMLRRVNAELPESLRSGYFPSSLETNAKLRRRGRRIYVAGSRRVGLWFLFVMCLASTLACAWELGFFRF